MVEYTCLRCGYKTIYKTHLKTHLRKKNTCNPVIEDISVVDCLQKLNERKKHICEYCEKEFSRGDSLKRHIETCKYKLNNELQKECIELKNKLENVIEQRNNIPIIELNQFIYLLQEREFIKSNEPIYKIGKTTNLKGRISGYPKSSKLLLLLPCENCHELEKQLIGIFSEKFIQRKDIGNEYFEGNVKDMVYNILEKFKERKNA